MNFNLLGDIIKQIGQFYYDLNDQLDHQRLFCCCCFFLQRKSSLQTYLQKYCEFIHRLSHYDSYVVQEPKEKRRGSLSFNSRVWQPCGTKYTFMLLYILAQKHFKKGTGDSKLTVSSPE